MNKFSRGFLKRLKEREIKVAVVGLGYVGLPLALEFAKKGFSVLGIDVDKDRIAQLEKKKSYITDISDADLRKSASGGKFYAEGDFKSLSRADTILICVPTPLKRKYLPDISFIQSAIRAISANMKRGVLIILESTTYPGTTEEVILPLIESRGLKHGRDFYLCFSPERIDPGNTRYPPHKIPKVIGGINKEATELGRAVYSSIITAVIPVSSCRVAETVKLLENTFRIVNIGLIDEIAMMAHKMDIDIWEVIDAAKTKPFGFMPFYPGPGVGGHCIPKDPLYLYWKAKKFGFKSRFIKLASDIITYMPSYVVQRAADILAKNGIALNSAKLLVVGVTYKKDIKDLRKSPAIDIIEILKKKGAAVAYYDPLIPFLKLSRINLKSIALAKGSLPKFDMVIIATDHTSLDYGFILKESQCIFDTRNVYKNITNGRIFRL